MNRFTWIAAPAVVAAIGLAPSAALGVVNWSNPTGSTPLFSWAGGYEDNGFFGSPTPTPNSLVFATPTFLAVNPGNPSITDTLHVNITVQPGQQITDVTINELGTRTSTVLTTVQGTLHTYDLSVGGTVDQVSSLVFSNGGGTPINWTGTVTQSNLGFGQGVVFHLDLTNNMSALLQGQAIQKTGVEIIFTPTPGTLAGMAGLAAVTLGRRRRAR